MKRHWAQRWLEMGVLVPLLAAACASSRSEKTSDDEPMIPTKVDAGAAHEDSGTTRDAADVGEDDAGTVLISGVERNSNPCMLGPDCGTIGDRATPLPSPVCPPDAPAVGVSCSSDGLRCSYGTSITSRCRRVVDCTGGKWQTTARSTSDETCEQQAEGFCPQRPPTQGSECILGEVDELVSCDYPPDVSCFCVVSKSFPGARGEWECYGPPRNGECPAVLPNLGDGCAKPGLQCRYNIRWGCYAYPYGTVYCYQGRWEQGTEPACSE